MRLKKAGAALDAFLEQARGLGDKLGVLLIQLPPSFAFDLRTASTFFAALRKRYTGGVAFEPRHASWFTPRAEALLTKHHVARVAADPAVVPPAAEPGGWLGLAYFRLHGAPRIYWSSYEADQLTRYSEALRATGPKAWCIFDNTARGAATENALALQARMRRKAP